MTLLRTASAKLRGTGTGTDDPGLAEDPSAEDERRRLPRKVVVGSLIVLLFVLVAVFSDVIAPQDPLKQNLFDRLARILITSYCCTHKLVSCCHFWSFRVELSRDA